MSSIDRRARISDYMQKDSKRGDEVWGEASCCKPGK
jgi:hypothetical protein